MVLSEDEIRLKEKELELRERELDQKTVTNIDDYEVVGSNNDNGSEGAGIAGLIFGVISFLGVFVPILGIGTSIIALVCGAVSNKKYQVIVLCIGALGLVLSIVGWLYWLNYYTGSYRRY
jgi:hypothetical protein